MDNRSLWKLIRDSWIKIQASFNPAIKPLVAKSELNLREWILLIAALTFEPEDTTLSHLMVRGPYTSSDQYLARLEHAAEEGFLEKVSKGSFRLSSEGRKAAQEFIKVARDAMVSAELLPMQESMTLAEMLERLVKICLDTPPPPESAR